MTTKEAEELVMRGFLATLEDFTKTALFSSVVLPALAALLYARSKRPEHRRVILRVHHPKR